MNNPFPVVQKHSSLSAIAKSSKEVFLAKRFDQRRSIVTMAFIFNNWQGRGPPAPQL